ncbi:MAG: hypothetical protein LBN95_05660 [Prevotellaceae bacterium]|jgi:hypothetical protein|nr:hypothetical protein [Prevotellaceae bacterium]
MKETKEYLTILAYEKDGYKRNRVTANHIYSYRLIERTEKSHIKKLAKLTSKADKEKERKLFLAKIKQIKKDYPHS